MEKLKTYSIREEKANYLTHALGVVVAVVATILLIHRSLVANNGWAVLAFSIYGFGMIICMLASTIYHFVQNPKYKNFLRHFDHGSIYVLIAASFSPVTLILLRNEGFWGWGLFTFVWLFALIGLAMNFGKLKANSHLKTASYVLMGLSIFIAAKPLIDIAMARDCIDVLYWMAAGGFFYIVGSFFYALAKREFVHAIFHVFVLLGLFSHIIATFLIPLK
ncbi:MAG TPA: hemolysin III family protein [Bacteroidales bacterium]|nr:hemolysin III family protein [Bacteroidales bacterium]